MSHKYPQSLHTLFESCRGIKKFIDSTWYADHSKHFPLQITLNCSILPCFILFGTEHPLLIWINNFQILVADFPKILAQIQTKDMFSHLVSILECKLDWSFSWITWIRFQIDPLLMAYSNVCVFMTVFIFSVWTGGENATIFQIKKHPCNRSLRVPFKFPQKPCTREAFGSNLTPTPFGSPTLTPKWLYPQRVDQWHGVLSRTLVLLSFYLITKYNLISDIWRSLWSERINNFWHFTSIAGSLHVCNFQVGTFVYYELSDFRPCKLEQQKE